MKRKSPLQYLVLFTILMALSSCYSLKRSVEASRPNSEKIDWPEAYIPEESSFFVHNEIDIAASPQVVWDILVEAENWPSWYKGATDVRVTTNQSGKLEEYAVFSWKTMGQNFQSTTIKEFEPPYKLSWEATKNNIRGYHAWLIMPSDQGCRVVTSEAQHGFLTFMQKAFLPNKLRKLHDVWLENLKAKAEQAMDGAKS